MKIKYLIILLITLTSCVSNRNNDVEFFIHKDNSVQYFFPATEWLTDNKEINFEGDILYREYSSEEDSIPYSIFNFTIYSNEYLFRNLPNDFIFSTAKYSVSVPIENIKIIYIDKNKTRYSLKIKTEDLNKIFRNADDKLSLSFYLNNKYNFESSKSFMEHINYYKEVILGIKTIQKK